MAKQHLHKILEVEPHSPAAKAGIMAGDVLQTMNGKPIIDVLDYRFEEEDSRLTLGIKRDEEELEFTIKKGEYEDLGLVFAESLMDDYQNCYNKCIFCFIDQMPPGMRKTLYFKDDDTRLSFLQGNYVTLTNLSPEEVDRICYYRLSPMNISVHTTNPKLRCEMLHNRFAGDALNCLKRFKEAGIQMNGQIVLCRGYNDGEELERSIHDLTEYIPEMDSLSVVPVGLTKYREGLAKLEPFDKESARETLAIIHKWQGICREHFGMNFVYASDEWYITAEMELPNEEDYDGYPQIENGVGMLRSLITEVEDVLEYDYEVGDDRMRRQTIATGVLAAPFMEQLVAKTKVKFPNVDVKVITIRNDFFGERITVSGLLTARDIIAQLKEVDIGERLLLPCNLLRSGEDVLLDDLTVTDIENALQTKVRIVKSEGSDFVDSLIEEY